jgi:hypothetical protein
MFSASVHHVILPIPLVEFSPRRLQERGCKARSTAKRLGRLGRHGRPVRSGCQHAGPPRSRLANGQAGQALGRLIGSQGSEGSILESTSTPRVSRSFPRVPSPVFPSQRTLNPTTRKAKVEWLQWPKHLQQRGRRRRDLHSTQQLTSANPNNLETTGCSKPPLFLAIAKCLQQSGNQTRPRIPPETDYDIELGIRLRSIREQTVTQLSTEIAAGDTPGRARTQCSSSSSSNLQHCPPPGTRTTHP